MLAPEIFVVVLTTLIAALKVFAPVFVLTAGGPDNATLVPSYLTYYHFFTTQRVGYAAAIAVVQMALTVALGVIFLTFQARQDGEGVDHGGGGSRHRRRRQQPGRRPHMPARNAASAAGLSSRCVIAGLLVTLFPFFLALINAIKSSVDYAANGPLSLPGEHRFQRRREVLGAFGLHRSWSTAS